EELASRASARGLRALEHSQIAELPVLYGDACADLARARAARYSAPLVDYLEALTAAAHGVVYGRQARPDSRGLRALRARAALESFPRAVRAQWRPMLLAAALFFVPLALGAFASLKTPELAVRLVPEEQLRELAKAYAAGFDDGRDVGASTGMAGFY